MDLDITESIKNIDIVKAEKKLVKYIGGILLGVVVIHMVGKFIDDNFTFRINKISNLPDPKQENHVTE